MDTTKPNNHKPTTPKNPTQVIVEQIDRRLDALKKQRAVIDTDIQKFTASRSILVGKPPAAPQLKPEQKKVAVLQKKPQTTPTHPSTSHRFTEDVIVAAAVYILENGGQATALDLYEYLVREHLIDAINTKFPHKAFSLRLAKAKQNILRYSTKYKTWSVIDRAETRRILADRRTDGTRITHSDDIPMKPTPVEDLLLNQPPFK